MVSMARITAVEVQRVAAYRTGPGGANPNAITNVFATVKTWIKGLVPNIPAFTPSFA